MRERLMYLLVSGLILGACVDSSIADEGIPVDSWVVVQFQDPSIDVATIYADPAGDFGLDDAYVNGAAADASLRVQVIKDLVPARRFSASRIRLVIREAIPMDTGSAIVRDCPTTLTVADQDTDSNGWTTFSSRLFTHGQLQGGAYSEHYAIYVDWSGSGTWSLEYAGDDILVKTADFDGDGTVNLSDIDEFATYFYNGAYDTQADFNGDGVEDVTDISLLAGSMGAACGVMPRSVALTTEDILEVMRASVPENTSSWSTVKSSFGQ